MTSNIKDLPLVSVIIPVYNAQDYLKVCINSVQQQSYSNMEIICINDGSTDCSENIIRRLMLDDDRIKLINIENHGQGYARNLGLNICVGKYVLFLDSDDFIEKRTLEITVNRAEKDDSDFVVFDWKYYDLSSIRYINMDTFFAKHLLSNNECRKLFEISPVFVVNKLYRKCFLEKNKIFFMEKYIYEDTPFWTRVVLCASKVSLVQSPLYRITISKTSSTKINHHTDWHAISYIAALENSIKYINDSPHKGKDYTYFWYLNLFKKFLSLYNTRVPKEYRKKFMKDFLNCFSNAYITKDYRKSKLLSLCLNNNWWQNSSVDIFRFCILYSSKMKPFGCKMGRKMKFKCKDICKRILRKLNMYKAQNVYLNESRLPLYNDVILFYGFDNRYTGNSRYLFEEMLKNNFDDKKIFFVTDNPLVPLENRIEPNSYRSERFMARAKTIVFESWVPLRYKKRMGTKWIQLWHGTPLKRMLFDSNEKYIVEKNPRHKRDKHNDILRWDYLISDNQNINTLFNSAFLVKEEKILACGYPRVKWLLEKKYDEIYKQKLKELLGVSQDKKIVLYVPTWRDYNYGVEVEKYNLDYLMNLNDLQEKLGDAFEIIYKDHPFLSSPQSVDFKNYCEAEIQELLLIADYLITDYSSVMFDALAINLPIILYCKDFMLNEEARGVYEDIWADLECYVCSNNNQIQNLIINYKVDSHYDAIRERYSYQSQSDFKLAEFIRDL